MVRDFHQKNIDLEEEARVTHIICEPCVGVKSADCVDVCPVDCIHEAPVSYYIDPAECIDCQQCVSACPVEAIFAEDEVPEKWHNYTGKNYAFFK
ncbi:MAG TPA: ferredoxin family protein [Candidatus Hodarchaeales archaeon]|nr:ferredoxin family protein [Candidatus Hodarchaeales archaeon]